MPQSRHMHYIRHCNEYKKNPYCQWFKKGQCESIYIKQHFFLSIYSSISRTYMRRPCLYVVDYHPFSTVTWCLLQKGYHCVCLSVSDTGRIQIVGSIYLFMDVLKHINHTEHINDML